MWLRVSFLNRWKLRAGPKKQLKNTPTSTKSLRFYINIIHKLHSSFKPYMHILDQIIKNNNLKIFTKFCGWCSDYKCCRHRRHSTIQYLYKPLILLTMTAGNAALRLLCTGCPWLEQVSEFSSSLFPFQELLFRFLGQWR